MTTNNYRNAITFPARVEQKVRSRQGTDSFSETVTDDLALFYGLLDALNLEMKGYFTVAEACYLVDVFNGTLMDSRQIRNWPQTLAWNVEDGASFDGLDKKWGVDAKALAEKLRSLNPAQAVWVWDRVQLFWRNPNKKPIKEAVSELFLIE